jgi:SAM-dependent methyltransferase
VEERLLVDFFEEEKSHWWHIAKRTLIKSFIQGDHLNILVCGIGGGMICQELKKSGHRVVGIDISRASCEYAHKQMGIPVINGDLEMLLPFIKEYFDIVVIADVLEHLDNDSQLLKEISLCLKPRGLVFITVPAYQHMLSIWDKRLQHKRRYSLTDINKKIFESGLSIKKVSYFHMLLYPFVYLYRKTLNLSKDGDSAKSDFSIFPSRLVTVLAGCYYCLERFLLKVVNLPFGLSIFVVGVKHG